MKGRNILQGVGAIQRADFWICGNAASVKSTLMKHLSSNKEVDALLTKWAQKQKLEMAGHYFWVAGSRLERSEMGMHRHLTLQLLSQDLALVQVACRDRWTSARPTRDWNRRELLGSALNLVNDAGIKLCLFIDGLDECEDGMHQDLMSDLWSLGATGNVKLCLSSRPWPVFDKALTGVNNIKLQDHTGYDIFSVACQRLQATDAELFSHRVCDDSLFESVRRERRDDAIENSLMLDSREQAARKLIFEVCCKADGNFLWITVILDSVCERIINGDNVASLHRFVDELPSEVAEYYSKQVYARIHKTYWDSAVSETAMALKIALLDYEYGCSPAYFLPLRQSILNQSGMIFDAHFGVNLETPDDKDLLEFPDLVYWVSRPYETNVRFRHRIVYDFLATGEMQKTIDEHVPAHFKTLDFDTQINLARHKVMLCRSFGNCGEYIFDIYTKTAHFLSDVASQEVGAAYDEIMARHARQCGCSDKSNVLVEWLVSLLCIMSRRSCYPRVSFISETARTCMKTAAGGAEIVSLEGHKSLFRGGGETLPRVRLPTDSDTTPIDAPRPRYDRGALNGYHLCCNSAWTAVLEALAEHGAGEFKVIYPFGGDERNAWNRDDTEEALFRVVKSFLEAGARSDVLVCMNRLDWCHAVCTERCQSLIDEGRHHKHIWWTVPDLFATALPKYQTEISNLLRARRPRPRRHTL